MTVYRLTGAFALVAATIAGPAHAERLIGLTAANTLVFFDSATPGTFGTSAILGLGAGEVLTGIDLRPATNTLYSVSRSGNLYSIVNNPLGAGFNATLVGTLTAGFNGNRFGIDFNPTVDRLRFVTDFDNNLRINPTNGVTITDGAIDAPGAEALTAAAYTNNVAGATSTTLYALDASGNQLVRATNPNLGTYVDVATISGVTLGGSNDVGFDISGRSGIAYFNTGATLYTLNLTTGQATSLGAIGAGSLTGLTVAAVPEPSTWATMVLGMGLVGAALRRRRRIAMEPAA